MKTLLLRTLCLILPLCLFFGCHSTERYEWSGQKILHGSGGIMKKSGTIEIWIQGAPDRDYIPLKVVESSTTGTIGVQSYIFKVLAKETVELGGDGFILLGQDHQDAGSYAVGSANTTSIGGTHAYTSGSAVAVPIRQNTYRALVFAYKSR